MLYDPLHPSKIYYIQSLEYFFNHCYPEEKKLLPDSYYKRLAYRKKSMGKGLRLVSRRALFRKLILQHRMKQWEKYGWQAV